MSEKIKRNKKGNKYMQITLSQSKKNARNKIAKTQVLMFGKGKRQTLRMKQEMTTKGKK